MDDGDDGDEDDSDAAMRDMLLELTTMASIRSIQYTVSELIWVRTSVDYINRLCTITEGMDQRTITGTAHARTAPRLFQQHQQDNDQPVC
jgi:hypothetical protein